MALSNNMTDLLDLIEENLGLIPVMHKMPEKFGRNAWAKRIKKRTLRTFSRYFGQKIRFVMNDQTTIKRKEGGRWVSYIKDECLGGRELFGAIDIDWEDYSSDNISMERNGTVDGYYLPNYAGIDQTFEAALNYQAMADVNSMYNNDIFVEFEEPNKVILSMSGGRTLNLPSYVINLLVKHEDLYTISPTMMETFESLATADIARFLFMNLRYFDGVETIFINVDLKLSELEQIASKREDIIEELKNASVSASNKAIPYIMTTSG